MSVSQVVIFEKSISQELYNMVQYPDIVKQSNQIQVPELHSMVQYQDMYQQVKSHKVICHYLLTF